jgi:hypothetical protein
MPQARKLVARLGGARLCYGKPVRVGERTVIPVASVRAVGGGGVTAAPPAPGDSAGGGGVFTATPVGFIDVGPEGARYQRIDGGARTLSSAAAGAVAVLALRAVARRSAGRRARLPRGAPRSVRGSLPRLPAGR